MIGRDPQLTVTSADDDFHSPSNDDPSWIETMWFPCFIPDQELSLSVRVWFSPNAGKQGGTISGWRGQSEGLFGDRWVEDFVAAPNLTDLKFGSGLTIRCTESLRCFHIQHRSKRVELDLDFTAIMLPNPVAPEESPGMFLGHFEQPGKVSGEVRFRDQVHKIDCYSIRDRSWGPRQMPDQLRLGNAYGNAKDIAFFTYINPDNNGLEKITGGYFLKDGIEASIVSGLRETQWVNDVPNGMTLDFVDATGRKIKLQGHCKNVMASNAGNGVYGILNLVKWTAVDWQCYGENHDIWSETQWLAAGRPKL